MSVLAAVKTGIYTALTSGTALTAQLSGTTAIYWEQAPDHESLPYVVYSQVAGGPLNITPSDIREAIYYIRGYAYSDDTAANIDNAISNILHGHTLSIAGYTNYRTQREEDITTLDIEPSGERVYSAGAYYRISLDS